MANKGLSKSALFASEFQENKPRNGSESQWSLLKASE